MRVTLSGLTGKTSEKTFFADGTLNGLRIAARVQKFFGFGDPSQIIIFNLSPDTRSALKRYQTSILIETCWRDGPQGGQWREAFFGGLLNYQTYRSGTDIVTVIYALSGLDAASRAEYEQTYQYGRTVKDVFIDLCTQLASQSNGQITFDEKNVIGFPYEIIGESGWSATGYIKDSIHRLAQEKGFSWSITDREIRATSDRTMSGKIHTIKEPELISANINLSTNLEFESGFSFECQYNPNILPHDGIIIQSSIPENSGRFSQPYKVNQVTHDLDTHSSNSFITSGTCSFPIGMTSNG